MYLKWHSVASGYKIVVRTEAEGPAQSSSRNAVGCSFGFFTGQVDLNPDMPSTLGSILNQTSQLCVCKCIFGINSRINLKEKSINFGMHKRNTWKCINWFCSVWSRMFALYSFTRLCICQERDTVTGTGDSIYKNEYLGDTGSVFDNLLSSPPLNPVSFWNLP